MKAEGWVIKGSKVNQSDKIAKLCKPGPLCPIRVWMTLAASVDSWGMMRGNKWTLKAKLGENDDHHGPDDFAEAIEEAIGVGLVSRWLNNGIPWLYVVGHDEEHDIKRRAKEPVSPRPPLEILNRGGDLGELSQILVETNSGQSPDSVPTKSGSRSATGNGKGETGKGKGEKRTPPDRFFDQFWEVYPRKKRVAKKVALRAWKKIGVDEDLLNQILNAVEIQKRSDQWTKEDGQFIPNPATWLNQERWKDDPEIYTKQQSNRRPGY